MEEVLVLVVESPGQGMRFIAKPSDHVGPREENRDRNRLVSRILRVPVVDRDRVAAFLVVVRKYRRELLKREFHGQVRRIVSEPRLGIQCRVLSCAGRISPTPGGK